MLWLVKDAGAPVMCCGQKMKEIVPGNVDAAVEKHVPVYKVEGNLVKVSVGTAEHPVLPEHYIEWVSLQTKQGNQRKVLHPGDKPEVLAEGGSDTGNKAETEDRNMKMSVEGSKFFTATLEDNVATRELVKMMEKGPISIDMDDYSGFEIAGSLGKSLPTL